MSSYDNTVSIDNDLGDNLVPLSRNIHMTIGKYVQSVVHAKNRVYTSVLYSQRKM